jgi:hypothetical protein
MTKRRREGDMSKAIDEATIKKIVSHRAEEFGDRASPREVTLEIMEADIVQGCRLFHAYWGAGESQRSLSGLLRDNEAPDTYPAQALGKVFQRWIETEGKISNARDAAIAVSYLYDPCSRHIVVLSNEDKIALINKQEWLPHIKLPEVIEVKAQPGIVFWWVGPNGVSQLRVYLAKDGRIQTEETFVQQFLSEESQQGS